jgi:hypothetical protein
MDFETIMLGLLALAVFLVPIFYIQRKQKGQANKVEQVFLEASQKQGLNLSKYDFWNEQYGIGMDEAHSKLYYWNNATQDPLEVLIDLHSIRRSAVDNMYREVNKNRVIDMIVLRLALHGPKSPELYLTFYNKDGSMMLNDELLLASKWDSILKSRIVPTPQVVKV